MSNSLASDHAPRALFFGMQGNFSHPVLRALLENGIEVAAIVIPAQNPGRGGLQIQRREKPVGTRSMLPLLHSSLHNSILELAWERQIPVWEVRRMADPETVSRLAEYQPDAICVACFSLYIPRVILDIPRSGCLNVHPSLLPANRGPDPLFWTFREGSQQTGVTIHLMDEGMDTGDIVIQESIQVPDGISYAQLESQCAAYGGRLLVRAVWDLYNGCAVPVPQDEGLSSYHPFPTTEDFVVHAAEWNAHHVYNFICGVAPWGEPIILYRDNQPIHVKEVISYSHKNTYKGSRDDDEQSDDELEIRCREGYVKVKRLV